MKQLLLFAIFILSLTANAQSIIGKWVTYDDETNEKKGLVEIYQKNQKYFAKIIKTYQGEKGAVCEACEGDKKNQPIIGLVVIEGLVKDGAEYNDGTVLDPESGDVYSCYLELVNKNKLKIRGYLGFSLFGRTQYWRRAA